MLKTDSNRLVIPVLPWQQITRQSADTNAHSIVPVGTTIPKGFTANVDVSATLDGVSLQGVSLAEGDIILLTAQTNPVENGIYLVNASPTVASRVTTAGYAEDFGGGAFGYTTPWKFTVTTVRLSSTSAATTQVYYIGPGVIGTDSLTVQQSTNFGNGIVYSQSAQKIVFIAPAANASTITIGPNSNANAFTLSAGDAPFIVEAPPNYKMDLGAWYMKQANTADKLVILYV